MLCIDMASDLPGQRLTMTGMPATRVTGTLTRQTGAMRLDPFVEAVLADPQALRRTFPEIATEVMRLCSGAHVEPQALATALYRDPFATAQVISIANSPMFAPRTPILGVVDAASRLGLDALRDVVLMVIQNAEMYRVRGFEGPVETIRRRAVATAVAGRYLAKMLRADPEYAFLAGLLHDVGELLLLESLVKNGLARPDRWEDPAESGPVREALHRSHTMLGAGVLRNGKLPSGVVDAALCHHDYKLDGKPHVAAHLVAASETLASHALQEKSAEIPPANVAPLRELGLDGTHMRAILDQLRAALPGVL